MLQVRRIRTADELALLAEDWDRLSRDVPFCRFAWHANWWRHFATATRRLYALVVEDENNLVCGIAPWFVETSGGRGRTIAWLGSGLVCSDYQTVLTIPDYVDSVTEAIADWLTDAAADPIDGWDLLQLEAVAAPTPAMDRLVSHLWASGNTIHREPGPNCWRIELPDSWEEYVATLSKSHRKQMRRFDRRMLDEGKATFHLVRDEETLSRGMEILVDLHQRRRQSLGEPGCFANPSFAGFISDMTRDMRPSGHLQLGWLEIDDIPAAAELQLVGGGVTYAYQSGVNPDLLDDEPGRITNIATLRRAIEQGHTGFDFLRGDEPYKAHWRAEPRETITYRIVPQRTLSKARHGLWLAGDSVKSWVKTGLELTGMK